MKSLLVLVLMIIFSSQLFCQDSQNMQIITEQEAQYPKGDDVLCKYIQKNIIYSEESMKKELDASILLSFDVLTDSTLFNIKVIKSIGYGLDKQVVEILKKIKYTPAIMMGIKIKRNVLLEVPIRTAKTMIELKK